MHAAVILKLKNNAEELKGKWYAGDPLKECVREGKYLDVNEKKFAWIKYTRENVSATKLQSAKQ